MATVVEGIGLYLLNVSGATNATPIVITTAEDHGYVTGERVTITGVLGNTAANGDWICTVTGAKTFSLNGSVGNGAYVASGTDFAGRKYQSLFAWETAHDGALGGNIYEGWVYDDLSPSLNKRVGYSITAAGSQFVIAGATGQSSTAYRHLRAAPGHEFNPTTESGARIYFETTNNFDQKGIEVGESRVRLSRIGVIANPTVSATIPSSGIHACVRMTSAATDYILDGVFARFKCGTGTSIYGFHLSDVTGGGPGTLRNCIAEGSNQLGLGMVRGLFMAGGAAVETLHNCGAYGVKYSTSARGFNSNSTGSNVVLRNCWAVDCYVDYNSGFSTSSDLEYCVSSDGSISGQPNCSAYATAATLFSAPTWSDYRPRVGSALIDSGQDLSASFTTDLTGGTRATTSPWEIGPYDGYVVPGAQGAPTVVVSSIGAGKTYATTQAWADATDLHLPGLNLVHVGEMYDQESVGATGVWIADYPADRTRHRILRAAPGLRYDPRTGLGAKLSGTGSYVLRASQDYFQLDGVGVEQADTGAANDRTAVEVDATRGVRLDGCTLKHETGTGTSGKRIAWVRVGTEHVVASCVVRGGDNTNGAVHGVVLASGTVGCYVYHCSASRVRNGASAVGILAEGSVANGNRVWNCAVALCDVCITTPGGVQSHNTTSDATAVGPGALVNFSQTQQFIDPANNDYRLPAASPNVDSALYLGTATPLDVTGKARTTPSERGAYDGSVYAETLGQVSRGTHYRTRCWSAIRKDGFAAYLTSLDSPIDFRGDRYLPVGSFERSASESVVGLDAADVEFAGPFAAAAFASADILAGLWDDATITEYVIDWAHPFAAPLEKNVWLVEGFQMDGERWRGTMSGVASLLADVVQGQHTRNCPYMLFSNDPARDQLCLLDRTAWEVRDVNVASVVTARLVFTATTGTGAGQLPDQVDGYYALGAITWLTGFNVGRQSECKIHVEAGGTATLTLQEETKFLIVAGDDFNIAPGDDKTWATCKNKFGNQVNFGGDRLVPGTDQSIVSPKETS